MKNEHYLPAVDTHLGRSAVKLARPEGPPPALVQVLPSFFCPIPAAESPAAERAEAEVLAWAERFEIYDSSAQWDYFRRSRFPLFPSKALPEADPALLALPGKQVMWLQSFDDVYSDESADDIPLTRFIPFLGRLTRTLEDPAADLLPGNRWAKALRDLRLSVERCSTPAQLDRWIKGHIDYFDGLLWEAAARVEGQPLSLDDYVAMWLKQSALYPCIAFTDIVCGYETPAASWSDPRIRKLREMASAINGWDNDLTSYNKEVRRASDFGFPQIQNLVAILMAECNCSVDEAAKLAGSMRDHAMARFIALRDEVAKDSDPATARYVHGLGQWIRAYLDYSGQSPRYVEAFDAGGAQPSGWLISDIPPAPDPTSLPTPACLAGWW